MAKVSRAQAVVWELQFRADSRINRLSRERATLESVARLCKGKSQKQGLLFLSQKE